MTVIAFMFNPSDCRVCASSQCARAHVRRCCCPMYLRAQKVHCSRGEVGAESGPIALDERGVNVLWYHSANLPRYLPRSNRWKTYCGFKHIETSDYTRCCGVCTFIVCAKNVCARCVLCTLIAASYDGRLVSPRCTLALLLSTFLFPINTSLRDEGLWLAFESTRIALPGLLSDPCSPCHSLDLNSGCGSRCEAVLLFVSLAIDSPVRFPILGLHTGAVQSKRL